MILATVAAALALQNQAQHLIGKNNYYSVKDGSAVYAVQQDDVVIDFKGGSIQSGIPPSADQSGYAGTGLLLSGRKNVTIRNLTVRGYRFNIRLENCQNVRIENCVLSGSRSIQMARNGDPIDLFLNIRSIAAWREYGAGLWVEGSTGTVVKKTTAKGSQNGIVLVDSSRSKIIENDVSYNSGWGIALARSSDNDVLWNRADFVNRPWAGGWGGDSAAVAVADGSHRNYFVGNSLTHSGDGFFLTHRGDRFDERAGKIELQGASNDNVVAYNDGSWSTANAFEGTFSTGNVYWKNWANDSLAAGFWLGYSDQSLVLENEVRRNRNSGVAIEHGERNHVASNLIEASAWAGVALWASDDWRSKAKPSRENDSVDNRLLKNSKPYELRNSTRYFLKDDVQPAAGGYATSSTAQSASHVKSKFEKEQRARVAELMALRPKGWKFYRETALAKGIQWIQMDDFAPRDASDDLVAWRMPDPGSFELMLQEDGLSISAPDFMQFDPTPENPRLVRVSPKVDSGIEGEDLLVGIGVSSQDRKRKQSIKSNIRTGSWDVKWFEWQGVAYTDANRWREIFDSPPLWRETTRRLGGDLTGKSPGGNVANHHFACVATTRFKTEGGRYIFRTISDDGIRLFVGSVEVISRWNHHGPTRDEAAIDLPRGVHSIRVEYCQEAGAAVLSVDWRKS